MTTTLLPLRTPRAAALVAFRGLLERDLRVVVQEPGPFVLRTLSQPLLLVFVFTYVFPTIGQGFAVAAGGSFTDVLVPGVLAITVLTRGIQTVALPLVQEFGYTGEIEDRVMAPLPMWAVGVAKILSGAVQALIGALVVAPLAILLPAEPIAIAISWPALIVVAIFGPLLASALGLVLGTFVEPRQVPLMFSVVILPITFLGATYYPWAALAPIRWLQVASLLNPLVYISEGFRVALTPQLPSMPAPVVAAALVLCTAVLGALGVLGFQRRVRT